MADISKGGSATIPVPTPNAAVVPGATPTKDIVDTAIANGQFKTLTAAVTAAGLVDTLKGKGPFTVFAPTDGAFAKLPAGTVDGLLKDKPKLAKILTYHVVPGTILAADLVKMADKDGIVTAKTVEGQDLRLHVAGAVVHVGPDNKTAVVKADVTATNGVIHVIDGVLMPTKM